MRKNLKNTMESLVTPIIPFSFLSKNLTKTWFEEGRKKFVREFVNGTITAGSIVIPFVYLIGSLSTGSFNYQKWPEIAEKRRIEREIQVQNTANNYFKKYDINNDGVLNNEEFLNYYKDDWGIDSK